MRAVVINEVESPKNFEFFKGTVELKFIFVFI